MNRSRTVSLTALGLALALVLVACASSRAAPSPTPPAPAALTIVPSPTLLPPTPTLVPPTPASLPSPTAVSPSATPIPPTPTLGPTPSVLPTASPTAGGTLDPKIGALLAKAKGITEYSYEVRSTLTDDESTIMDVSGKCYVKGLKMRREMVVDGVELVSIFDYSARVVYTWPPGQKTALKAEMGEPSPEVGLSPDDVLSSLTPNARIVGTGTVDGKATTTIQFVNKSTTQTISIWSEKGLPLRVELSAGVLKGTVVYSSYRFEKQPDSLFQLPANVKAEEQ